jgi:hypothetical protein
MDRDVLEETRGGEGGHCKRRSGWSEQTSVGKRTVQHHRSHDNRVPGQCVPFYSQALPASGITTDLKSGGMAARLRDVDEHVMHD